MNFSFGRKEKLKSKKVFEQVFAEGKHINAFPIKLVYIETKVDDVVPIKVAVVAPKRSFKNAVKRNRIKRLLREGYRLNKGMLFNKIEGNYAFVFLYLGKEMPHFETINKKMILLIQKFIKKEIANEIE